MRRIVLVGAAAVMVSVLVASGAALAKTINCPPGGAPCYGTKNSDTMTGTSGTDNMDGRAGNDTMKGKGGADFVFGGTGADKVIGGPGDDSEPYGTLWGGAAGNGTYPDKSDDTVNGALGNDDIVGGMGHGGVDHVFGGDGNDTIATDQKAFNSVGGNVLVTKEVVDCGAGNDTVYHDGKDVVSINCETEKRGYPF